MSENRSEDADLKQECGSCESIDKLQCDLACKEVEEPVTDGKCVEQSSAAANESEDISPKEKRTSDSSYGTENSILSSHLSLQALQALNDGNAQGDDEMRSAVEMCLYEQGPLNEIATEENPEAFSREFDSTCSSPLLNGHAVDNDVHITTEKPQENNSERNIHVKNRGKRILSFFSRKPHTSRTNSKRSNGDVIITIDSDEVSVLDPRPKPKPSFNDRLKGWLQPMDNKMNMKVFGSRKAMADELIRYKKAGLIIHPTSAFRFERVKLLFPRYVDVVVVVVFYLPLFFICVSMRFAFMWIVQQFFSLMKPFFTFIMKKQEVLSGCSLRYVAH